MGALLIGDGLMRKIGGEAVSRGGLGAAEKLVDLRFRQGDEQDAVLKAVVVEDVAKTRGDDDAEAVVQQGPGGMLAAGAATEIGARQQHGRALVAREIQD